MASRRLEGTALLVAGHGAAAGDGGALHTLGQVGEALLATGSAWQIKRLSPNAGPRYAADRATIKQHLDELCAEPVRAAVIVLLGTIVDIGGEPALVTGGQAREYPEDATLPLAWIRDRLESVRAEQLVAIASVRAEGNAGDPGEWLRAIGTWKPQHLIAIGPAGAEHPIVDSLLTGLCGDALDPRTGTVTMASLSAYIARCVPDGALQGSDAGETLAQPPPFAGLWDVRRSQLSNRAPRPRLKTSSDDLTGTVLPGSFRLDQLVARGTFGTVYRARQLAVERDVAVKVLHADIDPSSEDGRLFVHEIRSVGRIDNANVVRIHQADITPDGRLFYAMELLDGRDLQQIAQEHGPLPRARAVGLVRQLLAGLGAAHAAALVHADVKPANAIVVERDGEERLVLVDFGLSRLRAPDRPAESAGGTPAYMAPEQMHLGRVDARSDLFSTALTLVYLMTGWQRPNAFTPAPELDIIADADLRAVLRRALDVDPAKRFPSARELSAALAGAALAVSSTGEFDIVAAPFRLFASFTEADRSRLHGREADLAQLTERVLYQRALIYTAPSGTGKTSLLRAGLVPRMGALGAHVVYLAMRPDCGPALAAAISPEATTIAEAVAAHHQQRGGKLVLVLDRVEAALGIVDEVLGWDRWPAAADVSVVLSIREDHLARLVAPAQEREPGIAILRLPPLDPEGARQAIVAPLAEARLGIEPELTELLLADLQRAAAAIGPQMGWGTAPAVFPPHLQLACSVLYEHLPAGEATLTVAHYRQLGGFDTIVGEHLERVLDTELPAGQDKVARDLFLALVTTDNERARRPEAELLDVVGDARVPEVLEVLRTRGLLVRGRGDDGELAWELAHDSLVPRVRAWIDRRDLARRRAVELVRYHLRRSRPDAPSLLGRAELREVRRHADAVAALDAEWAKRHADAAWTPSKLVARSRLVLRRLVATIAGLLAASIALAAISVYRSHLSSVRAAEQEEQARVVAQLRDRDLGRSAFSLEPFDWDPIAQRPVPVDARKVPLAWTLHRMTADDDVGAPFEHELVVTRDTGYDGRAYVEHVETHGGRAFLVVARGPCKPSIVPLRELPGYAQRDHEVVFHVRVPTCEASRADTVVLASRPFVYGGVGEPPNATVAAATTSPPEQEVTLPAFRMDRTEITNAAFGQFAAMAAYTGIDFLPLPPIDQLEHGMDPKKPVVALTFREASRYCAFLGKRLPSSLEWTRALRGPKQLADGTPNPHPRRNLPWDTEPTRPETEHLDKAGLDGPADVGTFTLDRSPDGIADLAGNVYEWTTSAPLHSGSVHGIRVVRGGSWGWSSAKTVADYAAAENLRAEPFIDYSLGARCVSDDI
ncbi:MAG TPA: bifunctional serine/threonine-protein kinase/formylglycine-generating enzyme family protein [Kofleriaceae bacterium]|jgi:formylglycine-generating enzyme required for sulfatase activity